MNFKDPRIKKRIITIDNFIADNWFYNNEHLYDIPKELHYHKKIIPIFGSHDKFFLEQSLNKCKNYVKGDHPYSYVPNYPGLADMLKQIDVPLLSSNPRTAVQTHWAQSKYSEFLAGNVELEYSTKSARDWNKMQFIPKDVKSLLLKGWTDNDIESCVITLIYQLALNTTDKLYNESHEYDVLQYAVEYKDEFRQLLSKDLNLPIDKVKDFVSALVFGAPLKDHKSTAIYKSLACDGYIAYDNNPGALSIIKCAQQHPLVKGLLKDLKVIWKNILRWDFDYNKTQRCIYEKDGRYSSQRHKAGIYFKLEQQVGEIIKKELKRQKGTSRKMIWMHDGFIDPFEYDINLIINQVEKNTGFIIKIKQELFEY